MKWSKRYDGEFNKVTYGPLFPPPKAEEIELEKGPTQGWDYGDPALCRHWTTHGEGDDKVTCLHCGMKGKIVWPYTTIDELIDKDIL